MSEPNSRTASTSRRVRVAAADARCRIGPCFLCAAAGSATHCARFVVLTVFGVWLGLQVKWVSDRRAARAWIAEHPPDAFWVRVRTDADEWLAARDGGHSPGRARKMKSLSWMLRMLGEEPVAFVFVKVGPGEDEYDRKKLRRLFPEATVDVQRHQGWVREILTSALDRCENGRAQRHLSSK